MVNVASISVQVSIATAAGMKRKRHTHAYVVAAKRRKVCEDNGNARDHGVTHPVLERYYASLLPLRQWLLTQLPSHSTKRRRKLEQYGLPKSDSPVGQCAAPVTALLDEVIVGFNSTSEALSKDTIRQDYEHFSQNLSGIQRTNASTSPVSAVQVNETVDFAIWLLFNRTYKDHAKPPHILCHGMARASITWHGGLRPTASGIPGLVTAYHNEHVHTLKRSAWAELLRLLGEDGDRILINLLLHGGLFRPIEKDRGTYYQLSGTALTELRMLFKDPNAGKLVASAPTARRRSDIRVLRNRMFYAKASLDAKAQVVFGLRHAHVFHRFGDEQNPQHTAHILKYLFPRQFRLHNVFTSPTIPQVTMQPFHDYTNREEEIEQAQLRGRPTQQNCPKMPDLPKRLRKGVFDLVKQLQRRHARCPYSQLLEHYCPKQLSSGLLGSLEECTSPAQVIAYCQAVCSRVFPSRLLGEGDVGRLNWKILNGNINRFIRARRFETLTLEVLSRGMKLRFIDWLAPTNDDLTRPMSLTDLRKRQELLDELLYFMFDSFIIPLVRSTFHVTESSKHRNRLFYFRHDTWRRLMEPALSDLKLTMLEEIGDHKAYMIISRQTLGFSPIRLLPKETGMRPVVNLKRRTRVMQNGRMVLGKSINTVLAPVFSILNMVKEGSRDSLGSSIFSIAALYPRLQAYRARLSSCSGTSETRFYFVKVDVRSCFDNLPQQALLTLLDELISAQEYSISRHAQIKPAKFVGASDVEARPARIFTSRAQIGVGAETFCEQLVSSDKSLTPHSIFVDAVVPRVVTRIQALQLLKQHIQANVINIGKKYYKQKRGIAQGSVVSSLLCSLLYAQMERRHLSFLDPEKTLLTRLIDDFLLITTERSEAVRFLEVLHAGIPEYGLAIKPEKSLTNFEIAVENMVLPQLRSSSSFPYCGLVVDTHNLNMMKDETTNIAGRGSARDSLTVEYSKLPGRSFQRKMLGLLKIQLHTMLLDSSYNRRETVCDNMYKSMGEVARKMVQYSHCLATDLRPTPSTMIRTIEQLMALAMAMMKSRRNRLRNPLFRCAIRRPDLQCLTSSSFTAVMARQQSAFGRVLMWLRKLEAEAQVHPHGIRRARGLQRRQPGILGPSR